MVPMLGALLVSTLPPSAAVRTRMEDGPRWPGYAPVGSKPLPSSHGKEVDKMTERGDALTEAREMTRWRADEGGGSGETIHDTSGDDPIYGGDGTGDDALLGCPGQDRIDGEDSPM